MSWSMAELVDELIRVGLAFGAVFQLICIAAVMWVPAKEVDQRESGDTNSSDDDVSVEGSSFNRALYGHSGHVRRGRFEKKKRR